MVAEVTSTEPHSPTLLPDSQLHPLACLIWARTLNTKNLMTSRPLPGSRIQPDPDRRLLPSLEYLECRLLHRQASIRWLLQGHGCLLTCLLRISWKQCSKCSWLVSLLREQVQNRTWVPHLLHLCRLFLQHLQPHIILLEYCRRQESTLLQFCPKSLWIQGFLRMSIVSRNPMWSMPWSSLRWKLRTRTNIRWISWDSRSCCRLPVCILSRMVLGDTRNLLRWIQLVMCPTEPRREFAPLQSRA